MKNIMLFFMLLTLCYLLLVLLLFIFQRHFLYFPTPEIKHSYPVEIFNHDNETIKVIVLNKGQSKAILFFGGNGESVANSASDYLKDFPEHSIYLVNYRAYGGSSGSPEEQAIYSDALFIFDKIKGKHDSIAVIGRSLGTGVASYLSAKRTIEKMVLITPYDSVESIAKHQYPMFPVSMLLKDKFDSISRVNQIKAQTLIILAQYDRVIPLENSTRLIKAFPKSQLKVSLIKNTGHNSISNTREFHNLLKDFIQ